MSNMANKFFMMQQFIRRSDKIYLIFLVNLYLRNNGKQYTNKQIKLIISLRNYNNYN